MAEQWRIRRGTNTENNAFTGALGEVTMDTDRNEVRIHDGTTQGGKVLGRDYMTNCITEISQDITLEINSSGSLILKSGSKVYIPDGPGVFTPVTMTADHELMVASSDNAIKMLTVDANGNFGWRNNLDECFSGSTAPSGHTNMLWYDTANNVIKRTSDGGSTWGGKYCLPLCIAQRTSTTCIIKQVFNGFGYIGSTLFVLPGVKIAIPDDRNTDGTLKNRIETVPAVRTTNQIHTSAYMLNAEGISPASYIRYAEQTTQPSFANGHWYNPDTNLMYIISSGVATKTNQAYCLYIKTSTGSYGGTIVDFLPKLPFRAVDYSDTEFIAHQAMPSDKKLSLTVGVTGTQYTANSDGYFTFSVTPTASNFPCNSTVVIKSSSGTEKYRKVNTVYGSGTSVYYIAPVSKGDIFKLEGLDYGTWQTVEFVYANGVK